MKKEHAFILTLAVFGAIAGAAVVAILMSIAVPAMEQYLLTAAEKADWDKLGAVSRFFAESRFQAVMFAVLAAAALAALSFFLLILNPQIKNGLTRWRTKAGLKLLAVVFALFGWFFLQIAGIDSLLSQGEQANMLVRFLFLAMGTGALWYVAGEQGWAGDLSTWGPPQDAAPARTMLLGAGAGTAIFAVYQAYDWAFRKYFILVAEVLGRSSETSYLGFKQLAAGSIIGLATAAAIIAGFLLAFAPVRRDATEVKRRLVAPVLALGAVCAVLLAGYVYAGSKYDLNKDNFAATIGVSEKAKESRTILLFVPAATSSVMAQEWPLQVSGSGMVSNVAMELTRENLQKTEAYLQAHPEGTIFTYAARDMLMRGYYSLWDVKSALAWQVTAAETQLLPRMMLTMRLRSMPVTVDNLKLLEAFADERTWRPGGKSALTLAMGYHHFGRVAEAGVLLQRAKERGADMSKADFMTEKPVTNGLVRGKLQLDGKPLAGVKVALLSYPAEKQQSGKFNLTQVTLCHSLVDVRETGTDGSFAFNALGNGAYVLALMAGRDVIPFDGKPGAVTAKNSPGLIKIGPASVREIGTIAVARK